MSEKLELKTLRENNPRDFLASLGILRLLDLIWPELEPRLSWEGATPVISTNVILPQDWSAQVTDALQKLNLDPLSPLRHGDGKIIKVESETYRRALKMACAFRESSNSRLKNLPALLYASYSSQLTEEKTNFILPTKFSFSNGQSGKCLLLDIFQLIAFLKPDEVANSLAGKQNSVDAKSLRWHPAEYRAAAYRSHDPGGNIKGDYLADYPAFNILAFIGLTFYPSVPWGKTGATLGFSRPSKAWIFRWPVWSAPVSTELVPLLLHCPDLMAHDGSSRSARGITRAWQSERFNADKSLYFSPSSPAV